MKQVSTPHQFLLSALLFVVASGGFGIAAERLSTASRSVTKESVVISLRPTVQIESRVIRLRDVAAVTCSDTRLCERINDLDIEDALSANETISILPKQIEFRLRLAGVDPKRVVIRGGLCQVTAVDEVSDADQTNRTVTKAVAKTAPSALPVLSASEIAPINNGEVEREIVEVAKAFLQRKLPWSEDSVEIRLDHPVPTSVRNCKLSDGYEFTADLRSPGSVAGRVPVRIVGTAPQKPKIDITILMDVRHFDTVAVASRGLERGHVMTASDIYFDRRDVTELTGYCSDANELIGKKTKRSLRALAPLQMTDIDSTASRGESGIAVKRREQVRMSAHIGAFVVTAMGEAQQEGRIGDTITLKNLETNAKVQGRITAAGQVEVAY